MKNLDSIEDYMLSKNKHTRERNALLLREYPYEDEEEETKGKRILMDAILFDKKIIVRTNSLQSLADIGSLSKREEDVILLSLIDRNAYVREIAISLVRRMNIRRAIPFLLIVVQSPFLILEKALKALGWFDAKEAVPVLLELLKEEYKNDLPYKYCILQTLIELGYDIKGTSQFKEMEQSTDSQIAFLVSSLIEKISNFNTLEEIISDSKQI